MTKFILIRHAFPDYTKILNMNINLYYATCFAPLSTKGKRDAINLSKNEILHNSDLIITSPFTRAYETANIISKNNNLNIIVENELHEWLPTYNNFESLKDINKRSSTVLKKYLNYNKVIVVSHKVVIYSLIGKDTKMGDFHEIEMNKNKIKILKK